MTSFRLKQDIEAGRNVIGQLKHGIIINMDGDTKVIQSKTLMLAFILYRRTTCLLHSGTAGGGGRGRKYCPQSKATKCLSLADNQ